MTKRFGATQALDGVDLDIRAGTVHALVGENGAGKSTLGKILAGVHTPDAGSVIVDGERVHLRTPRHALRCGLVMIAQELALIPTRSVIENVFLGVEDSKRLIVDRGRMRQAYDHIVAATGFDIPPSARVAALSVAEQQQVEILRAIARNARLIVMDEPSSRLSVKEAHRLHHVVRSLAARGTAIVYVSHNLREVLSLSDVVTVLRDGRLVETTPAADESPDSLIVSMVGRTLAGTFPARPSKRETSELLRIEHLTRHGVFEDVSLTLRGGEIVALSGLVGAGRSELVRAIFGLDKIDEGRTLVAGRPLTRRSPRRMMSAGVAMIPESRQTQGLLLKRSVRENMTLRHLARFCRLGVVNKRQEARAALRLADELGVVRASDEQPISSLSGGNQQKVLFGRWLMERPKVLIADEPTSGIDVAAKRAIYALLGRLADEGVGILLISSELEEVLGLADRVVVLRGGRVVREFSAAEATERTLTEAAFGTVTQAEGAA